MQVTSCDTNYIKLYIILKYILKKNGYKIIHVTTTNNIVTTCIILFILWNTGLTPNTQKSYLDFR